MFILVASASLVIKDEKITCYNNPLMHSCLEQGANNVCQKDINVIFDLLSWYSIIRNKIKK